MPDMQKENKKEAKTSEETRSMVSQAHPRLEGKILDSGWEVKQTLQDDTQICFRVMVMNEDREWYKLDIRCPKSKFTKIGL